MANKNIFVMRVASRVAQIPAATPIPIHEEMKSYAHMKNAAAYAVLNARLVYLVTLSARG